MTILVSSATGGCGATAVAAALAAVAPHAVLVDLDGDAAAAFGRDDTGAFGVNDWLASAAPVDRLDELLLPGAPPILPAGRAGGGGDPTRRAELSAWCTSRQRHAGGLVIVDAGVLGTGGQWPDERANVTRLVVTRACYLALRRVQRTDVAVDAVVVLREPGRSLTDRDVERSLGAPVVACIAHDPAVARAVDAGFDAVGLPPTLRRAACSLLRALDQGTAPRAA